MAQTTANSLTFTILSLRNIIEWVKQIGHPKTGGPQTLFDAIDSKTIPSDQFNQLAKETTLNTNTQYVKDEATEGDIYAMFDGLIFGDTLYTASTIGEGEIQLNGLINGDTFDLNL